MTEQVKIVAEQVHDPIPDIEHLHAKDEYVDDAYRVAASLVRLAQACYALGAKNSATDDDGDDSVTTEDFDLLMKIKDVEFGPELETYLRSHPKRRPTGQNTLLFHIERRVLEILRLREGKRRP